MFSPADAVTGDLLPGGQRPPEVTSGGRILFDRVLSCQEAAHLAAPLAG